MLHAGAGKVDITPPRSIYIAGFDRHRISEGVRDPIYARAVVVDDDSATLALISADLIGLFKDDIDLIRKEVALRVGLREDMIVITATHNHQGPDTLGFWGTDDKSGADEGYVNSLPDLITTAVENAVQTTRSCSLKFGSTMVDRRGLVRNTRGSGLVDRQLSVLTFENDERIATIVNFGLHPETLGGWNRLISSDFVGRLCSEVERDSEVAMFVNGALAGVTPRVVPDGDANECIHVGTRLALYAADAMSHALPVEDVTIKRMCEQFNLKVENKRFHELAQTGVLRRRLSNGTTVRTEVGLTSLGKRVQIAEIPGEVFPEQGIQLKAAMASQARLVFCLANDNIGYIVPESQWDDQKYEETMSVSKSAAVEVFETLLEMIRRPDSPKLTEEMTPRL